ncbi:4'-phosphopantetheinyl transferase family protein [Kitasatospora sp. NPDC004745]|uniref:4'-phosphopantetheinyl transferase family protein n=1 Tax=unclassified Kitasatospora TaxID=2633591 RepID=UPI00340A3E3A
MTPTAAAADGADGAVACRVWWARTADHRPGLEALLAPAEAVRRDLYAAEADRRRFTVAAALLRLAAAEFSGTGPREVEVLRDCPDCPLPHGRPRITGPLDASVSYAGDVVLVAVTAGAVVGVDAEAPAASPRRQSAALRRALGERESAELGRVPEAERDGWLLRRWTYKEAVLKATGEGLRVPPTAVGVSEESGTARLTAYPGRPPGGGRTVLLPLGIPTGAMPPGGTASAAFLLDRDAPVRQAPGRYGRELFDTDGGPG